MMHCLHVICIVYITHFTSCNNLLFATYTGSDPEADLKVDYLVIDEFDSKSMYIFVMPN